MKTHLRLIPVLSFAMLFLLFNGQASSSVLEEKLKKIVSINSGSENSAGVRKVMETVRPWFEELGFKVTLKDNPLGKNTSGPLFIGEMGGEKKPWVTFVMHADTVFELSSPFQKITMESEHIMKGPGVMDDKGGIIVALEALKLYLEKNKIPKHALRVVITPSEETGGAGFVKDLQAFGKDSWLVLGLEPAYEDGGIVVGRKGNLWFEIEVKGKEAHAGKHHQEGINACHILASKIDEIKNLTNYKEGITVSIGHMEGGQDKFNIICGWAKAKLDTRFPSLEKREQMIKKISAVLKDPQISFHISDDTPPFSPNALSKPLIERYLKIIQKVEGVQSKGNFSSGTGDLNYFSREGLVIMDGLGPRGENLHTENEYLDLRTLKTRAQILYEFLTTI